jgi:hypothetical protein
VAAIAVFIAGACFAAVTAIIWPHGEPDWASRTWSAGWLAGVLLAGGAGFIVLRDRRRTGSSKDGKGTS